MTWALFSGNCKPVSMCACACACVCMCAKYFRFHFGLLSDSEDIWTHGFTSLWSTHQKQGCDTKNIKLNKWCDCGINSNGNQIITGSEIFWCWYSTLWIHGCQYTIILILSYMCFPRNHWNAFFHLQIEDESHFCQKISFKETSSDTVVGWTWCCYTLPNVAHSAVVKVYRSVEVELLADYDNRKWYLWQYSSVL